MADDFSIEKAVEQSVQIPEQSPASFFAQLKGFWLTFIGVNLPNDQHVREQYGSKSFSLANVNEAYDRSSPTGLRSEFAWSKEEADRSAKWGTLSGDLITDMHEVIGHASGKLSPALKTGSPAERNSLTSPS